MTQSHFHSCMACGKTITWAFAICEDCERIYGTRTPQWPEWLKFLWRDEARKRRQAKRRSQFEVAVDAEVLDNLREEESGRKIAALFEEMK